MTAKQRIRSRQSGAATVAVAMLLVFILVAAVTMILNISGTSVVDAARNEEQVAAFFLAESGIQRGESVLRRSPDPSQPTACTGMNATASLVRGSFAISGTAYPTGCDGTTTPCDRCVIASTGTVGSAASRTVKRIFNVSPTSGGASGCGGGGGDNPATTTVIETDWFDPSICAGYEPNIYPKITQHITVDAADVPAILLSNVAYKQLAGQQITSVGCVTYPPGGDCLTAWSSLSNTTGTGGVSVGSRGAQVSIPNAGDYALTQTLSSDTFFAAVGMKAGKLPTAGEVTPIGGYWDDTSNSGTKSNANNDYSGETNNGTLCRTPGPIGDTDCPPNDDPPDTIPNGGTKQKSRSWCYGADTLILGFSGNSSVNNNGEIIGFVFGSSPAATQVPNGFVEFPKRNGATSTESEIYSSMWYVNNPAYDSSGTVSSGGEVTASAGAAFTGTLSKDTTQLLVTAIAAGQLSVDDVITGSGKLGGGSGSNRFSTIVAPLPTGPLPRTYTLADASTGDDGPGTMYAASTVLKVTSVARTLEANDGIYSYTGPSTVTNLNAAINSAVSVPGDYTLSTPIRTPPTTILSNGTKVTATGAYNGIAPTAGKPIAIRWTGSGVGVLAAGTTVLGSPSPSTTAFTLSQRPTIPLHGVELCSGICAFFDHSSQTATTSFTVTHTNTQQWAAGLTCLSGVDTSTIKGLTGSTPSVTAVGWHEPVR